MSAIAALIISSAAIGGSAAADDPRSVLLRTLASSERACVVAKPAPLQMRERLREVQGTLRKYEQSGQLRWRDERAVLSGELKDEDRRIATGSEPTMEGETRDQVLLRFLGQWLRDSRTESNRVEPIPPAEAAEIATAALNALRSKQPRSADTLELEMLPQQARSVTRSADALGCRPIVSVSRPLRWSDWAFVTTGSQWASLAGEGRTWALRREGEAWRAVAFIQDWIS